MIKAIEENREGKRRKDKKIHSSHQVKQFSLVKISSADPRQTSRSSETRPAGINKLLNACRLAFFFSMQIRVCCWSKVFVTKTIMPPIITKRQTMQINVKLFL